MIGILEGPLRRVTWNGNKRSLSAAIRLAPDVLAAAQQLHEQAKYEACIELMHGTENWQADPRAWRLVGLSCLGLADVDSARAAFEQAKLLHSAEIAK